MFPPVTGADDSIIAPGLKCDIFDKPAVFDQISDIVFAMTFPNRRHGGDLRISRFHKCQKIIPEALFLPDDMF